MWRNSSMKITKKVEPRAKIKVVVGSNFSIETDPMLPKLHQLCCLFSRKGTFKTTAITNLMRMYREGNPSSVDRIIWVSPGTAQSNKELIDQLKIHPDDFLDPDMAGCVRHIQTILEGERDDFVAWKYYNKNFDKVMKDMKMGKPIGDDFLMSYFDVSSNSFRRPEAKYECYKKYDRGPVVSVIFDDVLGSKLMADRSLIKLAQSHRHQAPYEEGGALGVSLYFLVQSFKSVGGINRSIRNNASSFMCGKSKDADELKEIASSCAGIIEPEVFYEVYHEATKDSPHDFLMVDLHKKDNHPSPFRKNFDTFLIVDGVK